MNNLDTALAQLAARYQAARVAAWRARRAEMNTRLRLGLDATPEQVHQALTSAAAR